jgi:CubicO group peptidase (beta-lactamase class C family)
MQAANHALERRLALLLQAHGVTGAGLAVVRGGAVDVACAGVRDVDSGAPVRLDTVFDAASLSKPMVAYAVLQLADQGVLDLDEPLAGIWRPPVANDPAAQRITARHVLTHTCGLQNLRGKEPLRMHFAPGAWFSYSSVGFAYLQSAIECRTKERLEALMQRLVFAPLAMQSSSFEWQPRFDALAAQPHDDGRRLTKHRAPVGSASYSLQTTVGDYARFVAAVLHGERLQPSTQRSWLAPHVRVPRGAVIHLESAPPQEDPAIGWGLGWGLEIAAGTFFQWGKMEGVRAFVMGSVARQVALVLLTNGNAGLRLMAPLCGDVLPGPHPALAWLLENVTE